MKIKNQCCDRAKAGGEVPQHKGLVMFEYFAQHRVNRQRQNSRGSVKTLPQSAIYLTRLELQTVCNIAIGLPAASLIFSISTQCFWA